ncbi:GspE/PulE family protein [Candidatus Omnitrophota bacterium]
MTQKKVEEVLLEQGLLKQEQIDKLKKESKKKGVSVGELLVQTGLVNEKDYVKATSEILGVPYIDLSNYMVDAVTLKLIPESLARKYNAIPVFKIGSTLTLAMKNPKDIMIIDDLARKSKCEIEPLLASQSSIVEAIDRYYGITGSVDEVIKDIEKDRTSDTGKIELDYEKLAEMADQAPIVKLVNLIIMQAIKDKASDIHIEPEEDALKIRFRIDGVLHETFTPPRHLSPALISRIKVLSNIDISEKRKPQDGRFNIKIDNKEIDMRVSTFPTVYGENIVIRLLDRSSLLIGLDKIGFSKDVQEEFQGLIRRPHGVILVTGPTGSGKTTTLYSALSIIDTEEKNIITIEDPVEYHIGRVRQSQINPKAGLTFASGLRSILRQDPDIIMVGEIRDKETAEISVQAAMTGHLVFSTLHTNDAAGGLTRLVEMGVEPFLISSSVIAILAQRLVRKICENCKESYKPSSDIMGFLGCDVKELYRGKGCNVCKKTGYKGRIGIFEFLVIDGQIKKLITEKASSDIIKKNAADLGMKSLKDDGIIKVIKGMTTVEEVIKATKEE